MLRGLRSLFAASPEVMKVVVEDETAIQLRETFSRAGGLLKPVLDAPNIARTRQALLSVALSVEMAALEIHLLVPITQADWSQIEKPSAAIPARTTPLGRDATALFVEAMDVYLESVPTLFPREKLAAMYAELTRLGPAQIATLRHQLVLGDSLPPAASLRLKTGLLGTVALLLLAVASWERWAVPEWKGVALGEMAIESVKTLRDMWTPPNALNVEEERRAHAMWKDDVFARLDRGEVVDVDASAGEDDPAP